MSKNLGLIILDRSGSMLSMLEKATTAVNQHVKTVAKEVKEEVVWTLLMFDAEGMDYLYNGKASGAVTELNSTNFIPRGATPLLDAIGKGVNDLDEFIAKLTVAPEKVSVIIMTDGLENASVEHTGDTIKELIKKHEDDFNWQFIYLGANQDAFTVGRTMGIMQTWDYTPDTVGAVFASASMASSNYYNQSSGWIDPNASQPNVGPTTAPTKQKRKTKLP